MAEGEDPGPRDGLRPAERDIFSGELLAWEEEAPARLLVEQRLLAIGYRLDQVVADPARRVLMGGLDLLVRGDLLLSPAGNPALLIRTAPGDPATRRQESLALARLIADPWPPFCAASDGRRAELWATVGGRRLAGGGPEVLPGPAALARMQAVQAPHSPRPGELWQALKAHHAYAFLRAPGKCSA